MPGISDCLNPLDISGRLDSLDISGLLDSLGLSGLLDSLGLSGLLGSLDLSGRLDSLGISGINISGWAGLTAVRDDGLFGSPGCLMPSASTDRICFSDGSICQSSRQRFVWPGYCAKIVEFKQLN